MAQRFDERRFIPDVGLTVNLQEPGMEAVVNHDVKPVVLKAVLPVILEVGLDGCKQTFGDVLNLRLDLLLPGIESKLVNKVSRALHVLQQRFLDLLLALS